MKRRSVYVLIASIFAMLVPSPGRFVYGVTLVIELNLLMLVGTLINSLIKKINLEKISTLLLLASIISFTILFRQIMILLQPEIILTLGFLIYLLPISMFLLGYVFTNQDKKLNERLRFNMVHILTFSVYALLFFLIRDVCGYGTFTFFGKNHQIFEKVILNKDKIGYFSIIATIPGALMLSSCLLFTHIIIRKYIDIVKKIEVTE